MNELFAADPSTCKHISDLNLLLSAFGPYTGRYLANYPSDWMKRIELQYENVGPIEIEKAKALLRRAKDGLKFVTRKNLAWSIEKEWIENIKTVLASKPTLFSGVIANENISTNIKQLEDHDLSPTSEENIKGTNIEYGRVCEILMLLSPELIFIDPYLNPLRRQYKSVLSSLFSIAARGQCERIVIWSRASEVCRVGSPSVILRDIKESLQGLMQEAGFRSGREIEMILVEDESSKNKMHGRYFLTIKGGIRLDQGFQQLPGERRVDVSPVGRSTHSNLLDIYLDGQHDMREAHRLTIKS